MRKMRAAESHQYATPFGCAGVPSVSRKVIETLAAGTQFRLSRRGADWLARAEVAERAATPSAPAERGRGGVRARSPQGKHR